MTEATGTVLDGPGADRLNRVEAVAKRFDVSRSAIYILIKSGQLRSLKVGGSRRIPESAVQEFIERGCSQ